jgi:hypothetical protein
VKATIDEERQATGMVDMGVAQDHGINPPGIDRQIMVELGRFLPVALEEPAVEQNPGAGGFEQVHASGDLAGGAVKGKADGAHDFSSG